MEISQGESSFFVLLFKFSGWDNREIDPYLYIKERPGTLTKPIIFKGRGVCDLSNYAITSSLELRGITRDKTLSELWRRIEAIYWYSPLTMTVERFTTMGEMT